jgi:hypothetical protein
LSIDPPERNANTSRPRVSSAKYSGGPKRSASDASGGASSISATTLSVPAMKEPIAAIASAGPARPFCVMA